MNSAKWVGLGFVGSAENCHPGEIAQWGPITTIAPQICWGTKHPDIDPNLEHANRVFRDCRQNGLTCAGWAWCDAQDVEGEARFHAQTALGLGLTLFIANCEEPYDAHGNSSDSKYQYANRYAQAFRTVASETQIELGLTTTPRWASDGTGMRQAGATIMPQCFTGEVTSGDAEINAAVPFMQSWGWTVDRIRPLVQTYQTNGQYPDPNVYNTQSFTQSVGVVPYTLEQADPNGIKTMASAISRLPAKGPPPIPPDPGPDPAPLPPEPSPAPTVPFYRALYPPDARSQGKIPSPDGSDIVAVKRAISRAGGGSGTTEGWKSNPPRGFWKWQSFDDTYSNGFSHGSGSGSGVTGFQKACVACQPTGWYGKATHEALVNYRIPEGFQNGGEWAFDQVAVDLYKQASVG
jgi:hypothetical protein